MARLTFPDEGSRSAFRTAPSGRPLTSAAGAAALVYLDAGATTLADIQTTAGAAIAGSTLNLDAYSRFPLFLGPADGTDTLYVVVDGGPVSPMYARVDDRLDAVKATADAAETPTGAQAKATAAQAAAVQRANHTGTQSADTLTDGTTNKAFLATERTKLSGVATGATANSANATLLARANHTGTQLAATVSDFSTAVVTAASGAYVPRSSTLTTITYNADGTVATVTENDTGAVVTYTYNADLTPATESRVLSGVTTVRTFGYTSGNLTSVS